MVQNQAIFIKKSAPIPYHSYWIVIVLREVLVIVAIAQHV